MKKARAGKMVTFMLAALMLIAATRGVLAVSESTVRMGNVVGTAVGTLFRAFIQGKVHSLKDAGKCLVFGSLSGYGFYQSKVLVSDGKVLGGVALANLSFSVVENVAAGRNPLAYLSFSLPFVHLEVATPMARKPDAIIRLGVTTMDAARLIYALNNSDRAYFRNGLLTFESDGNSCSGDGTCKKKVLGWASGIFPGVLAGQPEGVYLHEVVHTVQSLQLACTSPEPFARYPNSNGKPKFIGFSGIKLQVLDTLNGLTLSYVQGYKRHWREVEAYHFAY